MFNFSKASSPRSQSTLPFDSIPHQFPSFATPFPRKLELCSYDPKFSNFPRTLQNEKGSKMTLINLLSQNPTKVSGKERWHHRVLRVFRRIPQNHSGERSLKKLKEKSPCPSAKLKRRAAQIQNIPIIQCLNSKLKKRKNFLIVVYLVKKFIQIIKTYTFVKRIFNLKNYHFAIIGDRTNYYARGSEFGEKFFGNLTNRTSQNYDKEAENLRMKKFLKVLKSNKAFFHDIMGYFEVCFRKLPIIMPDNSLKLIWDLILLFLILLDTLLVPLSLCFERDSNFNYEFIQNFDIFALYLLIIDMVLSNFTAYYSKGVIIVKKSKIIRNYFYHSFIWDYLSIMPYFLSPFINTDLIKMFLMLRLSKMQKIFLGLEEHLFLSDKVKGIYELFKLMILIIYVGHFFACIWIYMAKFEIKTGVWNSWIQNVNLVDQDWHSQYVTSLYFAVYTMVTVGYGDISPGNIMERSVCIFLMILSCGVFAYALNRFGQILEQMYQNDNSFRSKIHDFTHYMKIRKVDAHLQMRIKRFMEYMHDENTSGFHRGEMLLSYLSPRLKDELVENIYAKWIRNIPVLVNNFSETFLKRLSLKFEERTYSPEDIIYEKGEIDNIGLYFIVKGEVSSFLETKDKPLQQIEMGKSFGEYSFFSDKPREISIKSEQVTHVAFISRKVFLELIAGFDEDLEKFFTLKDIVDTYGNKRILQIACNSCNRIDHFINKCPYLNPNFTIPNIIAKFRADSMNERHKINRKAQKRANALVSLREVNSKIRNHNFESFLPLPLNSSEDFYFEEDFLENIEEEMNESLSIIEFKKESSEGNKPSPERRESNDNGPKPELSKENPETVPKVPQLKGVLRKRTVSPVSKKVPSSIEICLSPKRIDSSPRNHKAFEFANHSMLTEEDKAEAIENNERKAVSRKRIGTTKFLRFTFQTLGVFSRNLNGSELEKLRNCPQMPSEKSVDNKGLNNLKPGPGPKSLFLPKNKQTMPSIEELIPDAEKSQGISIRSNEREPWVMKKMTQEQGSRSLDWLQESTFDLDLDRLKIYKFYFPHNNIDQIILRSNLGTQKKRFLNNRKNRKLLIKQACKRKVYPV